MGEDEKNVDISLIFNASGHEAVGLLVDCRSNVNKFTSGRLALLFLEDRSQFVVSAAVATLSPMTAIILLLLLPASAMVAMPFAILFAAGMGIKTIVQATAAPRLMGAANYGQLQGFLLIPSFLAQAIAPFVSGVWLSFGS